jgi:nucleoside-diphosphate-sugar epimerase
MKVSGMRVAVTGASGFLGSTLCRLLQEQGVAVRAVHRRQGTPPALADVAATAAARGRDLTLVSADLESVEGARRAVEGCSAVVHAAARVTDWGSEREFLSANLDATAALLDAAEAVGCSRFVYVSTTGVHGLQGHRGTTEAGPYYGGLNHYQRSKRLAEKAVLGRNRPGFTTTSLRMGYLYGPADTTTTYRMFRAIETGTFGWIGDGSARTSLIYVEDACRALAAALTSKGVAGQCINITDGSAVAWKDLVTEMYRALGSMRRPRGVPKPIALAVAGLLTAGAHLMGSRNGPALSAFRVRRSTTDCVFSNEKARDLLGFQPTVSFAEGLKRAADAWASSRGPRPVSPAYLSSKNS